MNNKDSFEQRMKRFIEKHKSLMEIVDDKLVEIEKYKNSDRKSILGLLLLHK